VKKFNLDELENKDSSTEEKSQRNYTEEMESLESLGSKEFSIKKKKKKSKNKNSKNKIVELKEVSDPRTLKTYHFNRKYLKLVIIRFFIFIPVFLLVDYFIHNQKNSETSLFLWEEAETIVENTLSWSPKNLELRLMFLFFAAAFATKRREISVNRNGIVCKTIVLQNLGELMHLYKDVYLPWDKICRAEIKEELLGDFITLYDLNDKKIGLISLSLSNKKLFKEGMLLFLKEEHPLFPIIKKLK
jgi:uncharacterized membrane protein (DUF106 family)